MYEYEYFMGTNLAICFGCSSWSLQQMMYLDGCIVTNDPC